MKTKIIDRFKDIWRAIERRFLPTYVWQADLLTFWRERILFFTVFTAVVLGPLALVPSIILSVAENLWDIVALDFLAYGVAIGLLASRQVLSLRIRAWAACLVLYFLGLGLTIMLGWYGAAYIWLFGTAVMAGGLIGFKAAVIALILNLAGLGFVAALVGGGMVGWAATVENAFYKWVVTLTNFMLLNALVAITTALMLAGLKNALVKEREAGFIALQNEKKYRGIFDNSGEGIVVLRDGRPCFINDRMLDMIGWSQSEVFDDKFINWIYPEDRVEIADCLAETADCSMPKNVCAVRLNRINEAPVWVDVSLSPLTWEGAPANLLFFRDISERIEAEAEKRRLEEQLHQAQKMEAVGILAGGVSHDFNNLLQAISGYTQLLLLSKPEQHPDCNSLKAIEGSVERAAGLVRQLLLFSRKTETERKPVFLDQEVEQAFQILKRTIPRMIDIEIRPGNDLWRVEADPVQIEQMLLNLGSNAADAMPDGGKLSFELENITLDEEFAQAHLGSQPGRYVLLTVSDTGHGIDHDTIKHIFEPFFTTKEIGKGTGLGLASVYGIVRSHGGYINCRSDTGRGTTFYIYLPAVEGGDIQEIEDSPGEIPKGGTETILLVDDEDSIRDVASQVLKKFGYFVLTASSGEEAINTYSERSNGVDLVIMDIGMPGMGGLKCLQALLQIDQAVQVIIASGYSIDDQIKKSIETGAVGYIGKPYQLTDLLNTVRTVLDEKKPGSKTGIIF